MFNVIKEWNTFRVYLPSLDNWLKVNAGVNYIGNSADSRLTLWFSEEPSEEIKAAINAHWDSLTEIGEEAKWATYEARNAAVEAAKVGLLTASFDDLISAERKLLLNMALTDDDKDALLVKFPSE